MPDLNNAQPTPTEEARAKLQKRKKKAAASIRPAHQRIDHRAGKAGPGHPEGFHGG
jgi:hypothetical protein